MTEAAERVRLGYRVVDQVGIVEFAHAPTLNALTQAGMDRLNEIVAQVAVDPNVRVLVLTGQGTRAFSSGAHIRTIEELWQLEAHQIRARLRIWQRALVGLEELEKPVVAAINGVCVGGAAELVLACDIRVASTNAVIGFPETKLGLASDMGASLRLARTVGIGWAKHLMLTGSFLPADEAYRIGLVTHIVQSDDSLEATLEFVHESLFGVSPLAVGAAKRLIDRNFSADIEAALERELLAQSSLYKSRDVRVGYQAFKDKVRPVFNQSTGESNDD
jgi:enoyl-CoA hydratase/carnithine racemase